MGSPAPAPIPHSSSRSLLKAHLVQLTDSGNAYLCATAKLFLGAICNVTPETHLSEAARKVPCEGCGSCDLAASPRDPRPTEARDGRLGCHLSL